MKKRSRLKKGLAILLTATMVVGLMQGVGTVKVSAAESDEITVNTVSSNEAMTPELTPEQTDVQTPEQAEDKLITIWQWIDEDEYLDEETGSLALPGASEQMPALFEDVTAFLPTRIQATVVNADDSENPETGAAEEPITLGDWECDNYPEEGAYTGSYTFTATLPEGYTLSEEAEALTVTVELGGAQTYEAAGVDEYDNGFCTTYDASANSCSNNTHENCSGYQPATDSDGDGVYEISNAGQLYWFADKVNGGDISINAVLTADITVNTGVLDADGKLASNTSGFRVWTPIGELKNRYKGTFDGQGHTVSGLYRTSSDMLEGFFGYIESGGSVSNVGIVNSYIQADSYTAGVCGANYGTIKNCYYTGIVKGSDRVGGVCGDNRKTIENCYFTGVISGSSEVGGVCGSNGATIANCYYEKKEGITGGINSADVTGKAEGKDAGEFYSGEVAYLLSRGTDGSVWGQDLSKDKSYPVFDSMKKVYLNCKEGKNTYSNEDEDDIHSYTNGICVCGEYAVPDVVDGNYQIANMGNLYWFAGLVNGDARICTGGVTQDTSADAVLTADITVNTGVLDADGKLASNTSSFASWTPIGGFINSQHVQYTGSFDGKGHTIRGLYFVGSTSRLGFFGYVGSGGTVSNVGIVDSYFDKGEFAGGVCGDNYGGSIKNCYFEGTVSGSNAGGVCGRNTLEGSTTNCYHRGSVSATGSAGGICGSLGSGAITNCYHRGAVSGSGSAGGVCGFKSEADSIIIITNCYYETMDGIAGGINGADITGQAEGKDAGKFNSGAVAYLLSHGSTDGSVWGQDLSIANSYPVLDSTKKVYLNCNYVDFSYSNEDEVDVHSYTNGICTCGEYEVPNVAGGKYQIGNMGNLYWFAGLVNGDARICTGGVTQDRSANAVLIADITMNTDVLDADGKLASNTSSFRVWTPMGKQNMEYEGSFDGQGHTVSGLYSISAMSAGFFGTIGSGGSVSNVGIVNSYIKAGEYTGGVCGKNGGTIKNCYYTGIVSGSRFVGGVCGYSNGTIRNCYFTGAVSGSSYVGSVCGYKIASKTVANCYYETKDGITGGINGADITGQAEGKDSGKFNSGEVAYLLSQETDGSVWGQKLSEEDKQDYPVFGGLKVYQNETYKGCVDAHGDVIYVYANTVADPVYADHDMRKFDAKDATCTKDGNIAYWTCTYENGVYYKDEGRTEKYNSYKDEIKIPATGHKDEDKDGKCDTCGTYLDDIGAKLAGYSLSLNGNIGVNFYMELSEEIASNENAYMEFTLPNTAEKTKVYVTGTHEDGATATTDTIDDKTYYVFSCQVAAKEMTDEIQAQMIVGENEGTVYSYTVKDYADYILSHTESYDEKVVTLVKAMLNYGAYSQTYFGYQTEKPANADLEEADKALVTLTADNLSSYKASVNKDEAVCTFASAYLTLQSETAVHVYVKLADGVSEEDVTFKIDDSEIAKENLVKGTGNYEGYYILSVDNIQASALDDMHTFTVTAEEQTASLTYGPMSYCYSILAGESASDELKNVVKALYAFNQAADRYAAN